MVCQYLVKRSISVRLSSKVRKHVFIYCLIFDDITQDDDYHLPALTVRETLTFAAIIKLPSTISRRRKVARAEEVIRMLGLRNCADVLVGGELLKGISGGEKRRLSLACQMVTYYLARYEREYSTIN